MICARITLFLIGFLATMYAILSLFSTLTGVGIGMAVAAATVLGWGLCDWLERHE